MDSKTSDLETRSFTSYTNVILLDEAIHMLSLINTIVVSAVAFCGVVGNTMIVVVLIKQGFARTINISMMGLAISDLCCAFFSAGVAMVYNPYFQRLELEIIQWEFPYLTFGCPQSTFARIRGWITAFMTIERCLCVAAPLRVKNILTPRRHLCTIVIIYLGVIAGVAPIYYTCRLAYKFNPARNKTLLGLIYTDDREKIEKVTYAINNLFSPFLSFGTAITCTVILVVCLMKKSSWRQTVTRNVHKQTKSVVSVKSSPDNGDAKSSSSSSSSLSLSAKDAKIVKLAVAISMVFIVSATPTTVWYFWECLDGELSIMGKRSKEFTIINSVALLFECANSSVGLFLYFYMSSSFREDFVSVFGVCKQQEILRSSSVLNKI